MSGGLERKLLARIALAGPLTVAEYMAAALADPAHGYYMRGDPFGRAGDFVTAPEISQMFGELIGLWCIHTWQEMGAPAPVNLVELGPGRGTLMADLLRAARPQAAFRSALRIHLVEMSPALAAIQRAALAEPAAGLSIAWHADVDLVPDGPLILVANEFFDALPIHQFVWTERGWRERLIAAEGGRLRLARAPAATPMSGLLPPDLPSPSPGSVAELCPAAISLAAALGRRVAAQGGAALIIDYGTATSSLGDSLQAVRAHRRHDVLDAPGSADLTAHVDFAALARAAGQAGARCHGPVPQGVLLGRLGIAERAAALTRRATAAQARDIAAARTRLIDPQQMGSLFKALAITHPDLPVPAGFDPDGGG